MSRATLSKTSYTTAFAPTSIAGCQLWLDGADATTITGTSPVTQWMDKSGNSRTMTSVVGSGVLTYANNGIYCSNAYMFVTSPVNLINFSLFIVAKASPSSANCSLFVGRPNTSVSYNSTDGFGFYLDTTYTARLFINGNGLTNTAIYTNQNLYSYTVTSAGSISSWVNGNVGNSFGISARSTTAQGFALGAEWGGSSYGTGGLGGVATNGHVYEVIVYSTALTSTQRQQIEGYLTWKWGLQAQLPSFVPTSVGGTQLWLDGADITTQTFSGSNITAWNDKSGNNYHMNQLPATPSGYSLGYPIAGAAINGKSTVNFSPQAGLKQPNNLNGVRNFYWVGRISNSGGSGCYFLFGQDTYYEWHANNYSPSNKMLLDVYTSAELRNATASLYTLDANAAVNTTFGNINYTSHSSISILSVSGITGSSTLYQGICYDRNPVHIGWCGDLAEVLVFSTALTTLQHQQIEGYLAWKWGMQAQLPITHPYYSAAPTGHPHIAAAPVGANLRPALSQALVPAGVRGMAAVRKPQSYTQTFTYTGANQTFVVPSATTSLTVYMWGAGGGGGYSSAGGAGAYIQGNLTVTPGSSIIIIVGGAGITNSRVQTYGGGGGATNTGNTCGSGGGRSAIQFTAGTDVVTVAGGGGGGYYGSNGTGGAGDATTGTGANGSPGAPNHGGKGGSQIAGGAKGQDDWSGAPTDGGQYYGGEGSTYSGSGGGGGYYGGGGGGAGEPIGGGGGGGSSLTTALTNFVGYNSSDSVSSPYNGTYNPSGTYGAAAPGANVNGNPGYVVITYLA